MNRRLPIVLAGALIAASPLPAQAASPGLLWVICTEQAADALAGQPEAAQTIVVAAFGACHREEYAYIIEDLDTHNPDPERFVADYKRTDLGPELLARVLANRAMRAAYPDTQRKTAERPRYLEQ